LPPGGKFYCEMEMGCLDPDETTKVIEKISGIKGLS